VAIRARTCPLAHVFTPDRLQCLWNPLNPSSRGTGREVAREVTRETQTEYRRGVSSYLKLKPGSSSSKTHSTPSVRQRGRRLVRLSPPLSGLPGYPRPGCGSRRRSGAAHAVAQRSGAAQAVTPSESRALRFAACRTGTQTDSDLPSKVRVCRAAARARSARQSPLRSVPHRRAELRPMSRGPPLVFIPPSTTGAQSFGRCTIYHVHEARIYIHTYIFICMYVCMYVCMYIHITVREESAVAGGR
jgi:hypothetical protein